MQTNKQYLDSDFDEMEQLPRKFTVNFVTIKFGSKLKTHVSINGMQVGDIIDDNSKEDDAYRFHDVFHYTFATMLGWSPCTRAMMKRKRKSNPVMDEIEDGARATITEEALSLIIFNEAKSKDYFKDVSRVSKNTLRIIKEMTQNFEVNIRTSKEWESAILKGYEVFRFLTNNNGGKVDFDTINREIHYSSLN